MNHFRTAGRRAAGVAGLAALAAAPALALSTAASAEDAPSLTVSATDGLEAGQTVTVSGTGLDPQAGYYVATCVTGSTGPAGPSCSGDRAVPGSQLWVSNAQGATTPIAPDGTFTADLGAVAGGTSMTGTPVDCTASDCSVTLFYDHRNGFGTVAEVPVTFAAGAAAPAEQAGADAEAESAGAEAADTADADSDDGDAAVWWGVGGAVVAVVVLGGIAYAVRSRSRRGA